MSYHTSTQAPDVSSTVMINGCQTKKSILSGVEARILVLPAYCRPIISVDATFLTVKYKCTFMVAVSMTAENQLPPLAFAFV
jgi:hypothetical protein